ncbi:MBL fold metallo-hydrolase [Oleiphilus sp. HI0125]|uniref:MBL fold metallo-hydrolase n=2 Tax=Oleiphilus sp. HI0125 TaxID=1822266 RepID=UPI0009ED217E|nr:MBL fold metallo-hydrolase [Oleiphilus sp. HI0125]
MAKKRDESGILPEVVHFFDKDSNTFSYIVIDPTTKHCAIIDSVLDFNYASGRISHDSADRLIRYVQNKSLSLEWIIETHVHADHLSAAPYIKERLGGRLAIGEQILTVQDCFGKIFNEGSKFARDGSQFDYLFAMDEQYKIGNIECIALFTPGHTAACVTHVIGDAAFVGDTLFMPDSGTARCDFPGGSASVLYDSIQKIFSLPDETRLYMCHDYQPDGRELEFVSTVGERKNKNVHISTTIKKVDFVSLREQRDATLDMPRLIIPSLQVNMRAGFLLDAEDNGVRYFKVPINAFG